RGVAQVAHEPGKWRRHGVRGNRQQILHRLVVELNRKAGGHYDLRLGARNQDLVRYTCPYRQEQKWEHEAGQPRPLEHDKPSGKHASSCLEDERPPLADCSGAQVHRLNAKHCEGQECSTYPTASPWSPAPAEASAAPSPWPWLAPAPA